MIDQVNNGVQLFNEWTILTCCIFLFNFTDYCPLPAVRFEMGWWFLYFIYFNLAVNVTLIIVLIIGKIKNDLRRKRLKDEFNRYRKQVAEHNAKIDDIGDHKR